MTIDELLLLNRHLNGDLDESELPNFFQALRSSPDLRNALARRSVDEVLLCEIFNEDAALARLDETIAASAEPRLPRRGRWLALASIAALALLAFWFFRTEPAAPAPQVVVPPRAPHPVSPRPEKPLPEPPAREIPAPPAEAPRPEKAEPAKPRPIPETRPAVASIERVGGRAILHRGAEGSVPAAEGLVLFEGHGLQTDGPDGWALISFGDGTQARLGPDALISGVVSQRDAFTGKHLTLERGELDARVAPQPPGLPMLIATAQADARVVGTRLLVTAAPGATRLEVTEGIVRFLHPNGSSVSVEAGYSSVSEFGALTPPEPIRDAVQKRLDRIKPAPHELRWKSLPWRSSLREACAAAIKEKKSIYLLLADPDSSDHYVLQTGVLSNPTLLCLLQRFFICVRVDPARLAPEDRPIFELIRSLAQDDLAGAREIFLTSGGSPLKVFASSKSCRTEQDRRRIAAALPYEAPFLRDAVIRAHGSEPSDWKACVEGRFEPPAAPQIRFGAGAPDAHLFAAYARRSPAPFEGIKSVASFEIPSPVLRSMWSRIVQEDQKVEFPPEAARAIAAVFSALEGSIAGRIREVSTTSISGSLSGELVFDAETLGMAGDFKYDPSQRVFTSFRLISLRDDGPVAAAVELVRVEPKTPEPPPPPPPPEPPRKTPIPMPPEPNPEQDEAPPQPRVVVPIPGKPGFYFDPNEKKILIPVPGKPGFYVEPDGGVITPETPVVPVDPKTGKPIPQGPNR
jgi:ferric-dicitrate binding protein FerR (iron transport regulator)